MKESADNDIELINELHSARLRERFGEISLQVVKQDGLVRTSYLIDKDNTIRTLAIAIFSDKPYSTELNNIHVQVKSGSFIGETIRANGLDVIKRIRAKFKLTVSEPSILNQGFFLYGQLSEVFAGRNGLSEEFYAEVCEIYDSDLCPKNDVTYETMINPELSSRLEKIILHTEFKNIKITLFK